jgi:hypothetical protein
LRGYLLDTDHCIEILRRNNVVINKARSVATVPVWVSIITFFLSVSFDQTFLLKRKVWLPLANSFMESRNLSQPI